VLSELHLVNLPANILDGLGVEKKVAVEFVPKPRLGKVLDGLLPAEVRMLAPAKCLGNACVE
jgi:hypothetical protein